MAKYDKWLTEESLILLEGWARDGLNDIQIAHNAGIALSTLNDWKNRFSEISEALKKGREVADYIVENALFKSAIGFEYVEVTEEITDGKKHIKKVRKTVPPNPTAQIFWLKNRKPDQWKDRRENVITNKVDQNDINAVEDFLNGIECDSEETPNAD